MKFILVVLAFGLNLHASEHIASDDIWLAVEKAEALAKKYGPSRVLFATDLDNTLIKTNQDLASEPWFTWQWEMLDKPKTEETIACDIPDLLHFFHVTITLSRVSPVQEDQAKAIQQMQKASIRTMAITARGDAVASATFAHLKSADIDFSKYNLAGEGFGAPFIPFQGAKPVLYQRGVLFSDGQHKGDLLQAIVRKTKKNIRAVVFWDNDEKNTKRVFEAFDGKGVEVVSIRASRQDKDIQRFKDSDKTKVTQDYLVLRKLLDKTYAYPRPCTLPIDKNLN